MKSHEFLDLADRYDQDPKGPYYQFDADQVEKLLREAFAHGQKAVLIPEDKGWRAPVITLIYEGQDDSNAWIARGCKLNGFELPGVAKVTIEAKPGDVTRGFIEVIFSDIRRERREPTT